MHRGAGHLEGPGIGVESGAVSKLGEGRGGGEEVMDGAGEGKSGQKPEQPAKKFEIALGKGKEASGHDEGVGVGSVVGEVGVQGMPKHGESGAVKSVLGGGAQMVGGKGVIGEVIPSGGVHPSVVGGATVGADVGNGVGHAEGADGSDVVVEAVEHFSGDKTFAERKREIGRLREEGSWRGAEKGDFLEAGGRGAGNSKAVGGEPAFQDGDGKGEVGADDG